MLRRYAARTLAEVTTLRKRVHPMPAVFRNTVDSGMSAISERYAIVTPIERPKPGRMLRLLSRRPTG
jgi:hypothetical protein